MLPFPLGRIRRNIQVWSLDATPVRICERNEKRLFAVISEGADAPEYFAVADNPSKLTFSFVPYGSEQTPVVVYGEDEIWAVSSTGDGVPTASTYIEVQQVFMV